MNRIKYFLTLLGLAVVAQLPMQTKAQSMFAADIPGIIAPHTQTINYAERTLCYQIKSNVEFTVTSDADWLTTFRGADGAVYLHAEQNLNESSRKATVTFSSADGSSVQKLVVTQTRDESANEIPSDVVILPSSASVNNSQGGQGIDKTYDQDYSTLFHSQWSGYNVSESNPITMTYNFKNVEQMDYLTYVPRQDGNSNGNFGKVAVYVTTGGKETLYGKYDWGQDGTPKTVTFNPALEKPTKIRIVVTSGGGNYASCAEMEFRRKDESTAREFSIFADDIYTELRPGVTQESIDSITNPFIKSIATKLFSGTYNKEYRVGTYSVFSSPEYLSDQWNAPGKYYDHCEGVTGINISKGKHAIAVSGIPEEVGTIGLRVVAWYSQAIKAEKKSDGSYGDLKGGGPAVYQFSLKNGINVIEYKSDFPGLAYINYFMYGEPDYTTHPDVKVHFINGEINGYLSKDKTNDQMHELCKNAPNRCIDVVGSRVHSIWEAHGEEVSDNGKSAKAYGLYQHCKTVNGASKGYHQFMNVLDSLIVWEHRLIGFEKYNRIPKNHTGAYVNYTYYMFQGYYGVSFVWTQQQRVLNCQTIMKNDGDAIWGLSHEWGHQHQMQPYYCWGSLGEVSNNVFSYYNVQAMGYHSEGKPGDNYWKNARSQMIDDEPFKNGKSYYGPEHKTENHRSIGYKYYKSSSNGAGQTFICADFRKLAEEMKDSLIYPATDDSIGVWVDGTNRYKITSRMRGICHSEMGGSALTPFVMLNLYASRNWNKDFAQDLFESLRQTDDENGSHVACEKGKNEVDKYELIASSQNSNKNGKYSQLASKYPNSCWVKKNYLNGGNMGRANNTVPFIFNFIRKASRIAGYNLVPYFEQWGFLRTIAMYVGDYGNFYHVMTPPMYYEFKADMDQLVKDGVLKEIDQETVLAISNSKDMFEVEFGKVPNIPNE